MDIESRAQIADICDLKYAYSAHLDHHQLDDLVDLFTEDAVCEFGPYGVWEGRQAIRDGYATTMADSRGELSGIHAVTNSRILLEGDTATGTWHLLDIAFGRAGGNPLKIVGVYHETYVQRPEGWRISRSRVEFLWSERTGRFPVATS